jgi:phage terminase large subunit-like protein
MARSGSRRLTWCARDFLFFYSKLTNPDGQPIVIDPFVRFIVRMIFTVGLVELIVLLPKGNGKTTLLAALAVFHLLLTPNANCYIGAADIDQASEMYAFAEHFCKDPAIARLVRVRPSTRRILSRRDNGFIRVLASDQSRAGGKRQQINPTLFLCDELQAHDNDSLYVAGRNGLFKRNGLMVVITFAGHDKESKLGQLRAGCFAFAKTGGKVVRGLAVDKAARARKHKDGRLTVATSKLGNTVMLEWACTDKDDLNDFRVVKLANPSSRVTPASLMDALEAPGITPSQFARQRANVWAAADDALVTEEMWDELYEDGAEIPRTATDVVLVVDAANKRDIAAVTKLWERPDDGQIVVAGCKSWGIASRKASEPDPPAHVLIKGRRTIGQKVVREHIRQEIRLHADAGGRVVAVVYDPMFFGESAEILSEEGIMLITFDQSLPRQIEASERTFDAITEGEIVHDGDPIVRIHATNAGSRPVGEKWRFSKKHSAGKIDLFWGVVMGLGTVMDGVQLAGADWS